MKQAYSLGLHLYITDIRYLKDIFNILSGYEQFSSEIQLLLLDASGDEEVKALCERFKEQYEQNTVYSFCAGAEIAEAYNQGLSFLDAAYTTFLNSSCIYSDTTLKKILSVIQSRDDLPWFAIHTRYFEEEGAWERKEKFKQSVYHLSEQLPYYPLFLNRYVLRSDLAQKYSFKKELYDDCQKEYLLHCLTHGDTLYIIEDTCLYYCIPQERSVNKYAHQTARWWYLPQMQDMLLPLLESWRKQGSIPVHLQALVLYLIEIKFYFNRNMRYKYIIRKEEVEVFYDLTAKALEYIDDEVILFHSVSAIAPKYLCYQLLRMKKRTEEFYPQFHKDAKGRLGAYIGELLYAPFSDVIVSKQKYTKNKETGEREIFCELFLNYLFPEDTLHFEVWVNRRLVEYERQTDKEEIRYFGKVLRRRFLFTIRIPKNEHRFLGDRLDFFLNVKQERTRIPSRLAKRKLLSALRRKIKSGRLCPVLQYLRQWEYILYYLWYRCRIKQNENKVLMLSDSRAELSGNLAFIDGELKKERYQVQYFFKRSLKERKTKAEKKEMCRMMAEAKYILVDDFYPIIYAIPLRKGTRLIQVWHAMGAFKTVGFSRLGKPGGPNPRSISHRNYTDTITSAEGIRRNYAEAFSMPIEDVHATGIPRTDIFFDETYIKETKQRLYDKYPRLKGKKVVMFAPTFRGNGQNSAHYNFDWIDFDELQDALKEDYQFIIKLHPFIKNTDSVPKDNEFYLDLTAEREINDLLFLCDVLITDYSSVIFEASLLNVNTIFYVPDLKEYTESRDFYYPFEKYTFGKVAENMKELIQAILYPENDVEKLQKFKEHFCGACDGHATRRFVEELFLKKR